MEFTKPALMRRLDLPGRDLRMLDPFFAYPTTILARDRAIVCNLEHLRCIIAADEAFILLRDGGFGAEDARIRSCAAELQRRLVQAAGRRASDDSQVDGTPFEFIALRVALQDVCSLFESQTAELQSEGYLALDESKKIINVVSLERARLLKNRLAILTSRAEKVKTDFCHDVMVFSLLSLDGLSVKDEIEMLMDDDGDMAECCLTEKKRKMEASLLEKRIGESSNDSFESLDMNKFGTEELEMLLEAQFASIGSSINKLTMLMEYIKDTEGFINIELV
ncbi:magnesium transporter MRS2-C isoform X3 [Brachypodium distachyon]|uniref:magnesium transporter MRS2-C isoform X3 n=1 Tax=Brachypodium distachyon TaxID=15368 RepID=UPI00071C4545|nr:magnesium transporter MRS2-C isoform X3 [Brachypodium distachyon]|eukprot:XP_014754524.1 magnesium transporter MRS2-C isoform X3 [Brachypodium distachyon]